MLADNAAAPFSGFAGEQLVNVLKINLEPASDTVKFQLTTEPDKSNW